jgi:hypothetical protein
MQDDACRFHGGHRYELSVTETCRGCGGVRRRSRVGRAALWLVPAALWANALLLLSLVVS